MFINYITIALPHAAYLFILGMLFYFWLRLTYILTFVRAISEPPNSQEYKRLSRKSRILALFQLAMFGTWLALLLPDWISKVIMANPKYIILSSLFTACGFLVMIIIGGEAAKWLTHDEDFNEQLTKNNKQ